MRNKFPWVATTTHKGLLSEARKLTSYSSHSGLTSKMWILPDDKIARTEVFLQLRAGARSNPHG